MTKKEIEASTERLRLAKAKKVKNLEMASKPVITMDEIVEHRREQRNEENAGRHMDAQETWAEWVEKNGEDFEREPQQENLIREIEQVVSLNIGYGSPPYSLESAEGILLDIINDLTSIKERLGLESGNL